MTLLQQCVLYGAIAAIAYISVVCVVGLRALYKRRDELYSLKYAEFLQQKERVERQLRKDAPDD